MAFSDGTCKLSFLPALFFFFLYSQTLSSPCPTRKATVFIAILRANSSGGWRTCVGAIGQHAWEFVAFSFLSPECTYPGCSLGIFISDMCAYLLTSSCGWDYCPCPHARTKRAVRPRASLHAIVKLLCWSLHLPGKALLCSH